MLTFYISLKYYIFKVYVLLEILCIKDVRYLVHLPLLPTSLSREDMANPCGTFVYYWSQM